MKICKNCGSFQDDKNKICSVCGANLEDIDSNEFEWVLLTIAESQFEADVIKGLLEENGIHVLMKRPGTGFDISSPYANPILGPIGHWNIFVMKDELENAEQVIKSAEEQDGTDEIDNEGN